MEQLAVFCIILMCVYALVELVSGIRAIIRKRRTVSVYGIVTVPENGLDHAEWEAISLAFEVEEHKAQMHWNEERQEALEDYADVYKGKWN